MESRGCEAKYNAFFCSSLVYYQSPLSMFHLARPDFRQPAYGYLLPWEETTKSINLQSNPPRNIPCIAQNFIRYHEKLRYNRVLPIPPGAILLRSADDSPLRVLGFIRFAHKLGNKSLTVKALVLPHLGPDAILVDNIIMKTFGAKLDWAAERLFQRQ